MNAQATALSRESARALARLSEPNPLPPAKLEERRIIHPNDSVREQANAFRELRTCLLALGAGKNFVTLVAPVSEGCGGSFVARNLAAAFAFDDAKSALLIDCDARKPSHLTSVSGDEPTSARPSSSSRKRYGDGFTCRRER